MAADEEPAGPKAKSMQTVQIRPIEAEDAEAAATLCTQLGYPAEAPAVLARMRQIAGDANRAVLVACADGVVLGGWTSASSTICNRSRRL